MEQSSNSASTSNPHTDANTSYESRATSPPPQESIAERLASRLGSLSLTKHKLKPKSRSKSSGERHTGETSPTSPTTSTSAGSSNAIRAQGSYDVFSDLPPVPASYERELPPPPLAVAAAPYPADYAAAVMRPPPPPANNLQHDNDSTPTAEFTFAQAAAGTNVDNIASGNEHSSNHQVSGASQQLRTPQTTSLPRLPPRPDSSGSNSSTRGDQSSLLPLSAPGRSSNFYYPSSTVSTPTTAAATVHAHAQGSGLARVHSVSPPNNARAHLVPSNYQSGLRARPASSVELQTSSSSAGTSYPTPNYMDSINGPPPLQSAPAPRPVSYVSSPTGGITENQFTPASSSSSNEPRMVRALIECID
ncbi:hypothetical protein BDF22DRAFT_29154 [Syncephalis plumigaleata]|nr:hypothetical protein BDF22DRAFT_29154 [Syncephalis plumigaleata]